MAPSTERCALQPQWWLTQDGDLDCLDLYERHYSARRWRDGRRRTFFAGIGQQRVVLRTRNGDACFIWRKPGGGDPARNTRWDRQEGVCCAFFRNESHVLSSELIRQADAIADALWPDRRHYTYVNAKAIRSTNAGCCFLHAGWRRIGHSPRGLVILERVRPASNDDGCVS